MISYVRFKQLRWISIVILLLTGLNALAAGFSFMKDPSGSGIGISTSYLQHSPFADFRIPGIVLFTAIGLFSVSTAGVALFKVSSSPLFIITEGSLLTGWIIFQVMMVRDVNWMHIVCLVAGFTLMRSGWLMREQNWYNPVIEEKIK